MMRMVLLANAGVPWLWTYHRVAPFLLIPIILIELVLIRWIVRTSYGKALAGSATINVVSTLCGCMFVLPICRSVLNSMVDFGLVSLVGLVAAFVVTLLVERLVLSWLFRQVGRVRLWFLAVAANTASYSVLFALVLLGL